MHNDRSFIYELHSGKPRLGRERLICDAEDKALAPLSHRFATFTILAIKKAPLAGLFSCTNMLSQKTARSAGNNINILAVLGATVDELDLAIDSGEQRVIAPEANIRPGMYAGTALTNQDIASQNLLAAEALDAKAFAF